MYLTHVVYFFSTNYTVELLIVCIKRALNIKVVNPLLMWLNNQNALLLYVQDLLMRGELVKSQQLKTIQDWKTIPKFFLSKTLALNLLLNICIYSTYHLRGDLCSL